MSRESDNASPRPRGTGGPAYPSGTPPYGTPGANGAGGGSAAPRNAGASPERPQAGDAPKTETTLTTRIRINIPGSRPIPPVVVRSTLPEPDGEAAEGDASGATPAPAGEEAAPGAGRTGSEAAARVLGVVDDGTGSMPMPELPPEWHTPQTRSATTGGPASPTAPSPDSDTGGWFRPRRRNDPGPAPAGAQSPAPPPFQDRPGDRFQDRPGDRFAAADVSATTGQFTRPTSPASPFPPPAPAAPAAPAEAAGAPEPPRYERPGADPFGVPLPPDPADRAPWAGQGPAEGGSRIGAALDGSSGAEAPPRPGSAGLAGPPAPPTSPLGEDAARGRRAPGRAPDPTPFGGRGATGPGGTGAPAGTGGATAFGGPVAAGSPPDAPAGPFTGFPGIPSAVPASPPGGAAPAGRSAGGGPVPAPPLGDGFAGGTGGAGAPPRTEASGESPAPAPSPSPKAEPAARPKRRGRGRKLAVYAVTAVLGVGAVAYGAGLMLNQSDIPKGTTVLGTNIGGDSRDAAVAALDATVGKSSQQPLVLSIGGRTVQLSPATAGLTIDTNATVQALAKHSYNPVTVIGSLFSSSHAVVPTVVVDQQKLHAALEQLASGGAASSVREGEVSFKVDAAGQGSVVTVLPQSGQGLDVAAAAVVVQQAYQQRAQGSSVGTLTLPSGTVQPKVSAATVQQAASTIGKWAVSGRFYVKTAGGTEIAFGSKTFSAALRLVPNDAGKMVPTWNTAAITSLYSGAFNGLKTKSGSTVTVQDITAALTTLLENPNGPRTIAI